MKRQYLIFSCLILLILVNITILSATTIIIPQTNVFSEAILTDVSVESNFSHLEINPNTDAQGLNWANNLVLYYPFDVNTSGTTYDYTSKHSNGIVNGATWNSDGKLGGAYDFNGSSDITTTNNFNYGYTNKTITFWYKGASGVSMANLGIIGWQGTVDLFKQSTNDWQLYSSNSTNRIRFRSFDMENVGTGTWISKAIVIVYDSTGTPVQVLDYTNGTLKGTHTSDYKDVNFSIRKFVIGNCVDMGTLKFNGSLDEVMIFNSSLNSTQISAIYNNQSARFKSSGTQTVKQVNITSGYNQVNLTTSFNTFMGSNISARIGTWDISLGYNNTDLNSSANGLVGYWHLDSNNAIGENSTIAVDVSGRGNNGTVVNATFTPNGKIGGAYDFNGNAGTYIGLNSFNGINTAENQSLTLVAWVYLKAYTGTSAIIGTNGYMWDNYGNRFFTDVNQGAGYASGPTPPLNTWTFLVLTSSNTTGGQNITTYQNGVFYNSAIVNNKLNGAISRFRIGEYNANRNFNGSLDEVMIFNRTLSSSEITELYVKGRANWNYTIYQNLSTSNIFDISTTTTNLLPDFKLFSDINNFYSPNLIGGINLETYDNSNSQVTNPLIVVLPGGGSGGSTNIQISPDLCNITYPLVLNKTIYGFVIGSYSKDTVQLYLDNWQLICSDYIKRTLEPKYVCNKIYYGNLENLNLSQLKEKIQNVNISLNLLAYYNDYYYDLCYYLGYSPNLPGKDYPILNIDHIDNPEECIINQDTNYLIFPSLSLGKIDCITAKNLVNLFQLELSGNNYSIIGLRMGFLVLVVMFLSLILLFDYFRTNSMIKSLLNKRRVR